MNEIHHARSQIEVEAFIQAGWRLTEVKTKESDNEFHDFVLEWFHPRSAIYPAGYCDFND